MRAELARVFTQIGLWQALFGQTVLAKAGSSTRIDASADSFSSVVPALEELETNLAQMQACRAHLEKRPIIEAVPVKPPSRLDYRSVTKSLQEELDRGSYLYQGPELLTQREMLVQASNAVKQLPPLHFRSKTPFA